MEHSEIRYFIDGSLPQGIATVPAVASAMAGLAATQCPDAPPAGMVLHGPEKPRIIHIAPCGRDAVRVRIQWDWLRSSAPANAPCTCGGVSDTVVVPGVLAPGAVDWYAAEENVCMPVRALAARPLVVTRHPALVTLLRERGIVGPDVEVIAHATPEQLRGRHVIGVLPLHLAAEAAYITEIPQALAPEDRGRELPIERLREVAGEAVTYRVQRV